MGTTTKKITNLLMLIDSGELILPEIQRDFVWRRKDILLLFDSLYRGLPIGHMLVWKAKIAVAKRAFGSRKMLNVGGSIDSFYGYLLDGQQRLTAIKLVRDSEDEYPLMFALWPEEEDNPDADRFSFRTRWNSSSPWYLPVSDIITNQETPLAVVERLRGIDDFDYKNDGEQVLASVARLQGVMDYEVGIIEFEDNDYRNATELFIRFNSTGKKLSRNDLVAAELALSVPHLVSQGVDRTATKYFPRFTFTKPFLIQCLTAVHTGKMKFASPKDIWDGSNETILKQSWKRTEIGLGRAIDLLSGTVKWNSESWVPSFNALIPLVYLLAKNKLSHEERKKARKWLLLASVHAIFSGSVHSELDRILRGLKRDSSLDKLWNLTKRKLKKLEPEDFETGRRSGALMSLYISMLRNRNAKDWITQTPLDGNVIGHNADLQVHHFFPLALLKENGFASEKINAFANYTIINKETNIDISAEEPAEYLKRLGIEGKNLRDQCIPLNKKLWTVDRYDDFIKERQKILASNFNAFLKD